MNKEETQSKLLNLTKKGKIETDWSTLLAIIGAVIIGVGLYMDVKNDLRRLIYSNSSTIHRDEFKQFGTQLKLRNPQISVPDPDDYMRPLENKISLTPSHGGELLTRKNN